MGVSSTEGNPSPARARPAVDPARNSPCGAGRADFVEPAALASLAAGAVGFTAIVTQLVMMRELLTAFSGNELVFGISLGVWLLLTGAGTWLGRMLEPAFAAGPAVASAPRRLTRVIAAGLGGIALLPLIEVAALRGLRDAFFLPGAAVGVFGTIVGCFLFLAPFCLLSGALLTLTCGLLTEAPAPRSGVGRIYVADAIGSVAGGVLFTFALAPWCDHFGALALSALPSFAAAAWLARSARAAAMTVMAAAAAAACLGGAFALDLDGVTAAWQHRGAIVRRANSAYGRLIVTRRDGQLVFFQNGLPIAYGDNAGAREEAVHYAMAQRPGARRVLLISGAVSGAAREVLQYSVRSLTVVELDPRVAEIGRELRPENFTDPRLELALTDGRRFVQRTGQRFEVVILDLPDPATLQLNRFFTAEFFAEVKRVLAPDGVFAFGLSHYENFVSRDLANLLSTAHHTLRSSFAQVRMVPGGRVFFLASDADLTMDIAGRIEGRGITTELVNRHYLDAMLAPDRLADMERAIARPAAINRDFSPVLYAQQLRHWLGQFSAPGSTLEWLLLAALAAYFAFLPAVPRVVFASGFAASALEVVLLVALQVGYGSLYQQVGVVVAVFMAGFAAGAVWAGRRNEANGVAALVARLGFLTAAIAGMMAFLLPQVRVLDAATGLPWVGPALILIFAAGLGAAVGGQFPPAGAASPGGTMRVAARLFGADLAGASAGALLVSAWLIPALGVSTVCLLTAALCALAAALLWRQTSRAG